MKKSILVALAIVGAAAAQADNYPYSFSVRGGVIFPIDSSWSRISDSFAGIGIDYAFEKSFIAGGETFLSLEYQGKDFGKSRGSVWPLTLNQKWYFGNEYQGRRPYYFAGVGIAFIDFAGSDTAAAFRIGAGKEFSEHVFAEATLQFTDKASGISANGLGLYLGYRF
jgi:hypothetical protein